MKLAQKAYFRKFLDTLAEEVTTSPHLPVDIFSQTYSTYQQSKSNLQRLERDLRQIVLEPNNAEDWEVGQLEFEDPISFVDYQKNYSTKKLKEKDVERKEHFAVIAGTIEGGIHLVQGALNKNREFHYNKIFKNSEWTKLIGKCCTSSHLLCGFNVCYLMRQTHSCAVDLLDIQIEYSINLEYKSLEKNLWSDTQSSSTPLNTQSSTHSSQASPQEEEEEASGSQRKKKNQAEVSQNDKVDLINPDSINWDFLNKTTIPASFNFELNSTSGMFELKSQGILRFQRYDVKDLKLPKRCEFVAREELQKKRPQLHPTFSRWKEYAICCDPLG